MTRAAWRTRAEGQEEQQEDDRERGRDHDHEPPRGPLLVLELPAPLDEVAGGQLHRGGHPLLRLGHEAADVAAAHVRLDDEPALAALVVDGLRALDRADVGDARRAAPSRRPGRSAGAGRGAPGRRAPRPGSAPRRRSAAGRRGSRWRWRRRSPSPRARARPRRSGRTGRSGPGRRRSAPGRPRRAPRPAGRPRRAPCRAPPGSRSPTRSSVAGSGPKTLTATSAFTPETTSSRRMAMGWVKLQATPGISASAAAMWSMSSSFDQPLFHSSDGVEVHVDVALVDAHGLGGHVGPADLGDDLLHLGEAPDDLLDPRRDGRRLLERDRTGACASRRGSPPRRGGA